MIRYIEYLHGNKDVYSATNLEFLYESEVKHFFNVKNELLHSLIGRHKSTITNIEFVRDIFSKTNKNTIVAIGVSFKDGKGYITKKVFSRLSNPINKSNKQI